MTTLGSAQLPAPGGLTGVRSALLSCRYSSSPAAYS